MCVCVCVCVCGGGGACTVLHLQVHKVIRYLPDMFLVAFLGVISKEESSFKFTSL